MKKIFKNTFIAFSALSLAMVGCKDAEPVVDTTVLNNVTAERETLTVGDGYWHGDVYKTGGGSYKVTATLMSTGMGLVHSTDEGLAFKGYSGTGYAFELELNSEYEDQIAPGTYVADTLDYNGEYYMNDILTYNPENTYLMVVNNGSAVKQQVKDLKVDVKLSGETYTIAISGTNGVGVEVKGTFVGKLPLRDVTCYCEPLEAKTFNLEAERVTYAPYERNKSHYANIVTNGDTPFTIHYITVECKNGEKLVIEFMGPGEVDCFNSVPSGDYSAEGGVWDLLNSKDEYDTEKDYRAGGELIGSYMVDGDDVYYVESGSFNVQFEAPGSTVVTSFTCSATTMVNGLPLEINYTKQ